MTRATGLTCALALLVALAACSQDTTSPAGDANPELSAAEAQFLAESLDRQSDAAMGRAFDTGMGFGPPVGAGAGTWSFTFENTRQCPEGGQVTHKGSGDFSRDSESRSFEMTVTASKTIVDCAFLRGEVLFTLNGESSLDVYMLREDGQLVAAERHIISDLLIVTDDGRSWECHFELHSVYDGETRSFEVSGRMCGRPFGGLRWTRG